jgi:hypothetical protein
MTTITVRASSWGSLFDCAYKWEGEHLLGMRRPSGLRASLGTAIHAGTAHYDLARLEGKPVKADEAAEAFVDALHNPEGEVDYTGDKTLNLTEAEVIGLALTTKYCNLIAPHFEYRAVEMALDPVEIDTGDGLVIRLTGTMDRARIATAEGGVTIPDIKSGARIIENGEVVLKAKSAQLGAYQIMYEAATGEATIGGQIIGLQTTKKAEVAVSPIFDAKAKMIGTPEAPGFIELAATMFKTGFFPPNPQSQLCSEKFCARWHLCNYHD